MTLDVCIIAATAHFSGLKNWLPVLHVHVYGTLYAIVHVRVRVIFSLALHCHNVLIIAHHTIQVILFHLYAGMLRNFPITILGCCCLYGTGYRAWPQHKVRDL